MELISGLQIRTYKRKRGARGVFKHAHLRLYPPIITSDPLALAIPSASLPLPSYHTQRFYYRVFHNPQSCHFYFEWQDHPVPRTSPSNSLLTPLSARPPWALLSRLLVRGGRRQYLDLLTPGLSFAGRCTNSSRPAPT